MRLALLAVCIVSLATLGCVSDLADYFTHVDPTIEAENIASFALFAQRYPNLSWWNFPDIDDDETWDVVECFSFPMGFCHRIPYGWQCMSSRDYETHKHSTINTESYAETWRWHPETYFDCECMNEDWKDIPIGESRLTLFVALYLAVPISPDQLEAVSRGCLPIM